MNVKDEMTSRAAQIEEQIKKYLPTGDEKQKKIYEAMNYSLLAGGKRLRPMLMMETYRLFGGKSAIIEPFMAAIEMIHTYSLVHDDLPAMDNDEYRRGRKTTHIVYGEAMGILAGDGLLNFAFETALLAKNIDDTKDSDTAYRILDAIEILAKKAGVYGMIGGQVIDIEAEKITPDLETLNQMYKKKTSALIEASMMVGAVLAGAAKEDISKIEQIANNIGLAFQIQDDILDVTSTTEVLGKPIHSDEKNQKVTYVTLLGIENAKNEVKSISECAINELRSLPYQNEFLLELTKYLIVREY